MIGRALRGIWRWRHGNDGNDGNDGELGTACMDFSMAGFYLGRLWVEYQQMNWRDECGLELCQSEYSHCLIEVTKQRSKSFYHHLQLVFCNRLESRH